MNIEENLILIKGEDKTEKVITCVNNNGKCLVTFDNNKTYTYSSNNVKWFRNSIEINAETTIIYENNGPISGVVKIFKFEQHIRVCFKSGYKKLFNISDILMEKTSLNNKISNNYFEYLKKLSANVSITLDDESSFLSKQYNKIKIISPRSVLSSYLKVQALKKRKITNEIIFPFGFNISQKSASDNTNIGDLIKYIQYNNFEIINSNISSVFDFLYSNYSKKLLEILNKNKRVSEFASENLMNMVIEKVLCQEKFKFLDVVLHQPLKMLIKDTSKLTEIEHKFVKNILTHTDFIIFNKLDKMPVLVVEVDGYAFHANNKVQLERDKMKDEILTKYNIPILRISTNGSGEELKLSNKLSEVLKPNSENII
ncbi:DUF2726 domain-containing protein [Clostridium estertheticum]|uniref:DUF2726 domain-containing protein n=1 Tax=Clostridium estertheticum TaxID=238834 RepID=UPI001CF42341|nr:DUF2726 domain-containing protein [Clostridium estertheticum]MCB2308604.1 DUF2726 domain-containing protein [Clostridium estertheticum]MCB2344629.1 DUF2726 domain-containing protein [Clostridium estertheticum]MCB2351590.1 DUF2726 domain-containing protein [Clostridium estertheticum]WAG45556.1 DUF2726 domain-containing protein [Clostridium estertheticum]